MQKKLSIGGLSFYFVVWGILLDSPGFSVQPHPLSSPSCSEILALMEQDFGPYIHLIRDSRFVSSAVPLREFLKVTNAIPLTWEQEGKLGRAYTADEASRYHLDPERFSALLAVARALGVQVRHMGNVISLGRAGLGWEKVVKPMLYL